jgi:hypothetical protein
MTQDAWTATPDGVIVDVRLTPRGGRDAIEGIERRANARVVLKARVRAAPFEGEANAALCGLRRYITDQTGAHCWSGNGPHRRAAPIGAAGQIVKHLRVIPDWRPATSPQFTTTVWSGGPTDCEYRFRARRGTRYRAGHFGPDPLASHRNDKLSYSSRRRFCRARGCRTFPTIARQSCRRARDRTRRRCRSPRAPTRSASEGRSAPDRAAPR